MAPALSLLFFSPYNAQQIEFALYSHRPQVNLRGSLVFMWGKASGIGGSYPSLMVPLAMSIDLLLVSNQWCLDVCFSQQSLRAPPIPTPKDLDPLPSNTFWNLIMWEIVIVWCLLESPLPMLREFFGPFSLKCFLCNTEADVALFLLGYFNSNCRKTKMVQCNNITEPYWRLGFYFFPFSLS